MEARKDTFRGTGGRSGFPPVAHESLAWLLLEAEKGRSAFPQTRWSLWELREKDSDLGGCLSSVPSQMSESK